MIVVGAGGEYRNECSIYREIKVNWSLLPGSSDAQTCKYIKMIRSSFKKERFFYTTSDTGKNKLKHFHKWQYLVVTAKK